MRPALRELGRCLFTEFLGCRQPARKRSSLILLIKKIAGRMGCDSGLAGACGQVSKDATLRGSQSSDNVCQNLTLVWI